MNKNYLDKVQIVTLNNGNFNKNSLDDFILNQNVTKCWRKVNDRYILADVRYIEDWNLTQRREMAQKVLSAIHGGDIALAAVIDNTVIGFAIVKKNFFGSERQYVDLAEFYVSQPYRRYGIGKILFEKICGEAKNIGAKKLYISAHSAEESISAYKKYGCVFAQEIDKAHLEKEPCDLQLEYDLTARIYQVEDKEKYIDLLLLADEQRDMVEKYLNDGVMYVIDDFGVIVAVCKHFKHLLYYGRSFLVNDKSLFLVHLVAEQNTAAEKLTFRRCYSDTALDLLRQFRAVIFRHTFKYALNQNTARVVRDILFCREYTNAVFL